MVLIAFHHGPRICEIVCFRIGRLFCCYGILTAYEVHFFAPQAAQCRCLWHLYCEERFTHVANPRALPTVAYHTGEGGNLMISEAKREANSGNAQRTCGPCRAAWKSRSGLHSV